MLVWFVQDSPYWHYLNHRWKNASQLTVLVRKVCLFFKNHIFKISEVLSLYSGDIRVMSMITVSLWEQILFIFRDFLSKILIPPRAGKYSTLTQWEVKLFLNYRHRCSHRLCGFTSQLRTQEHNTHESLVQIPKYCSFSQQAWNIF